MSLLKNLFYSGSSLLPLSLLRQFAPDVLLPYHHLVSDEVVPHIRSLYSYKNRKQFSHDLDYLLANFKPASPIELIESIRLNRPLPKRSFLLTFDDGFREVYDVIAPILLRKGVPALFFLNPAFLNNRQLFYRCKLSLVLEKLRAQENNKALLKKLGAILRLETENISEIRTAIILVNYKNSGLADELGNCMEISFEDYLNSEKPFLDDGQVSELKDKGFHFGAHSIDHPNYKLLPEDEQIRQTISSCRHVKETFALSYTAFSFPHEDISLRQSFFDRLSREEFTVDLLFGTQNQKAELHNRMLHRFNAERPDVPFEKLVKGMLLYNGMEKALHKDRVIRR